MNPPQNILTRLHKSNLQSKLCIIIYINCDKYDLKSYDTNYSMCQQMKEILT